MVRSCANMSFSTGLSSEWKTQRLLRKCSYCNNRLFPVGVQKVWYIAGSIVSSNLPPFLDHPGPHKESGMMSSATIHLCTGDEFQHHRPEWIEPRCYSLGCCTRFRWWCTWTESQLYSGTDTSLQTGSIAFALTVPGTFLASTVEVEVEVLLNTGQTQFPRDLI
ncbi:hypothetical protein Mapa_012492 [Marchantia paleacea]|nr:hypothetical protein Mapa_012492 [Marchantia paleacea]